MREGCGELAAGRREDGRQIIEDGVEMTISGRTRRLAVPADGFCHDLFDGMPFKALAGIRYESTHVTAQSLEKVPDSIQWNNPTEFSTNYAANATYSDVRSSYAEFLPNLDMSLEVVSGVLLRGSYSKTIARSDLTQMIGTTSVTNSPKPGSRTATEGNPGLLPYESNNIDLGGGVEYSKGSYVAANWFTKHVTNFLTEVTTQQSLFGITDPNAGALATKAIAELTAAGKVASAQNIFAQIVTVTGSPGPFVGQPGDPLVIWDVTTPTNGNKTDIHGFELSVQHIFGDSGFWSAGQLVRADRRRPLELRDSQFSASARRA